jgi:hypothetical protein
MLASCQKKGETVMGSNRIGRRRPVPGFDPMGPGAAAHFERQVAWFMRQVPYQEHPEYFLVSRMREDMEKADYANNLSALINRAVHKFLSREGHIDDAYEIIASNISERAFRQIARDKYGLIDPLD